MKRRIEFNLLGGLAGAFVGMIIVSVFTLNFIAAAAMAVSLMLGVCLEQLRRAQDAT